jgi:glycosyltransferase involved in cell wall biosynthesis
MKTPLISIVIPTYNYAAYLQGAIESALAQTYKNIELLIVDDGSTDATAAVAKRYKKRLKYYYKENGGVSSARNYGARHIQGDYVVFLDADDVLAKDYVQKTLALLLQQKQQVGYVYTQLKTFEASSEVTQYPGFRGSYLMVGNYIAATCLMKAEIAQHYLYDTRLAFLEDWDYYLTLLGKGIVGVLLNEPLLYYRKHSNDESALDTVNEKKRLDSYHIIRMKHQKLYGKTQTLLYLAWFAARKCNIVSGVRP